MKYFYTYVLQSLSDGKLYVGWTLSLKRRFEKHSNGQVESTKFRGPWKLLYFEGCLSKKKAIEREKSLKSGFGRSYLKHRLQLKG